MKVDLWDCYYPSKISVGLNKSLKDEIKNLIEKKVFKIADNLGIHPARLYEYFIRQSAPIPLDVLLRLTKIISVSPQDIEKNITFYKQMFVPIKNSVNNPKLPIEINPYMTSIVANLFFDGSVPKDGRGTYYNQKNSEIMDNFTKKINSVFGDVAYYVKLDHKSVLKCGLPRIIGEICKSIYVVNSFGTFDSKVPDKIFALNKKHKEAFILTALIDEGSITYGGDVMFGVCNKQLCEGVAKLCNYVDLETTDVTQKSNSNYYYFYIKSREKLLQIINSMKKSYPLISLNYKEERLRCFFEIKKNPGVRTRYGGNTRKAKILASLKEKPLSVNQLSVKLLIPPRSVRRHLTFLMDMKKIIKQKIRGEYIYF